jgi:hypothetical protein
MLAMLRRFRILALVALAASPGVAGGAVQYLAPCPVADAPVAHHATGMPGHAPAAPTGSHESCHCIGACCPAAVVAPPAAGQVDVAAVSPRPVAPFVAPDGAPAGTRFAFLPPATAPPLPV